MQQRRCWYGCVAFGAALCPTVSLRVHFKSSSAMQLLAGNFCKSRGSECKWAQCLQLWLGPPQSTGKLVQKGLFAGGERDGSTVLIAGAPPFCACVCISCSGAGKHGRARWGAILELENPVMLFPSSLCHSLTRCLLRASPVRMSLQHTPFLHRKSC